MSGDGRTALVTGAALRIGAAIAEALAADGWRIAAHHHASAEAAAELCERIRRSGGLCDIFRADLSDRAQTGGLIARTIERCGRLDLLVNNASSFRYDTYESFDAASWDAHVRPNLEAPLVLARDFAAALGSRPGHVINMLDHKVTALNPDFFSYTIAKIGLSGATKMLAQAFGGRILVGGIAPGITLPSGKQTEAGFRKAWTAPPLGRSSTPEDLVEAVRLLLAVPGLNGQTLVLDGGESLLGRKRDIAFL